MASQMFLQYWKQMKQHLMDHRLEADDDVRAAVKQLQKE
jgi:hypothetical protein